MTMSDDQLAAAMRGFVGRVTELLELERSNVLNHVLHSGTVRIPAAGFVSLETSVPFASVIVNASQIAGPLVTVANAPPASTAPTSGAGVLQVAQAAMLCVPLVGVTLTVYGQTDDLVYVGLSSRLLPAAGA